jgi:hypothetical protein
MSAGIDGTENHTVRPCRLTNELGAMSSIGLREHTHAPFSHAMNMSNTERSKVWSKVCERRSSGPMP